MHRWLLVLSLALSWNALAKTPKPLVTIELERRVLPWPDASALALPADVSAAVASLAAEVATSRALEAKLTSDARAQDVGESPTILLEKSQAAARSKRNAALGLLRPAAKTAPQLLLLAHIEADQAQDAYDLAVEAEAKAPKLVMTGVETACGKALAQFPDPATARQLAYLLALALEARGQSADAIKQLQAAVVGAEEPWRSELNYRIGHLALAKDPAGAQAAWAQVSASPFVTYAGYRAVTEFAKAGQCPQAADALAKLKAAPALSGTSFVDVATQTSAACKPRK